MLRTIFLLSLTCLFEARAGSIALSVDAAADYALRQNPTLAAARLSIAQAQGRLQHSGRLSNPELDLEFARMTRGREGLLGVSLMQRFPLTARLRFEKAASRAELAAAEAEVRDGERKLAAEVRAQAIRLIASRGQRELRARLQENSRELAGFLQNRVESGEAAAVEATQVDLETQVLQLEALQLSAAETALAGELRALLGAPQAVTITGELPAPKSIGHAARIAGRADIEAAEHRLAAAEAAAQKQRASRWEDFGVAASYTRERTKDEPESLETDHVIGLRVSIPLPLWNDNAGRIQEAEATAARATEEVMATRFSARAEAATAREEMAALVTLLTQLDAQLLPKATQIEEQIRQQYATGQSPLTDVLRARSRRLELQRQRLDALRDYHLARVRFEAATSLRPARGGSPK